MIIEVIVTSKNKNENQLTKKKVINEAKIKQLGHFDFISKNIKLHFNPI